MERFVRLLVGGGLALVAGLWVVSLFDGATLTWVGGVVLAALGVLALAAGVADGVAD